MWEVTGPLLNSCELQGLVGKLFRFNGVPAITIKIECKSNIQDDSKVSYNTLGGRGRHNTEQGI